MILKSKFTLYFRCTVPHDHQINENYVSFIYTANMHLFKVINVFASYLKRNVTAKYMIFINFCSEV